MKNDSIRNTLRFMQWVALTFILTLGIILAFDAYRSNAPLKSGLEQLSSLKQQDMAQPQLAQAARDLDFLYRSAFFQTKDKQRRGVLLLGIALFALCGLMAAEMFLFAPKLKIPAQGSTIPEKERRQLMLFSSCGILVLCGSVFILRLLLIPPAPVPAQQPAAKPAVQAENMDLQSALEAEKAQWPQFRGSVLPNTSKLPAKWDFQVKWNTPISLPGNNSPIVWNDNVFLSGADSKERAILCINANVGTIRWKTATGSNAAIPHVSDDTGLAAPTLCADSKRVYAIFATGEILCCDHDGNTLWQKQMPAPAIQYGYASSPLLLGDKLIIQFDLEDKQTLYALNVFTGDFAWQTVRESAASWSSPAALIQNDKAMIFTAGNSTAELFDLDSGKLLWKQQCLGGEVATSAFPAGDKIFFSNTGAFTGAFAASDGKILFQNENVPAPDVASPVLFGNQFLLFGSGGTIIAIDAKDGHELYEENLDNGFYASPVVVGNKIVAVNLDGDLLLFSPSTDKIVMDGKFSIGKKVVCIPAFHQGRIIIRTDTSELICLEAKP